MGMLWEFGDDYAKEKTGHRTNRRTAGAGSAVARNSRFAAGEVKSF